MLSPISMDSAFLSLSADLLPDTSGLAPLALPDEFLSGQNAPRQQPSPEAIRRFQSALASDTPSASTPSPLQALSSLSQSATPPPTPEEAPLQALPISTVPVPLEAPPVSTEPPSALPPVAPLSPIPDTPSIQSAPLMPASVLPQSTPTAPSIPSPVSTPSHEQIPAQSLAPALSHPSSSSLQSFSSLPAVPPSPNLAKAAAHLAKILFSRFEAIPPETLQERELRITLPPTILDASTIVLTAQNSSLLVQVIPSNSETIPLAFALLPYLTDALASRLPASMPPQVVLATPESPAAQPATISALPETTPQSVAPATQPQRSQMNPLASSDATPPAIKLADLLPDTSGLSPLTLPPEFFSARFQTPPAPEAIRRFQTVLSAPPPTAPESPSSPPPQSLPSLESLSSLPPSADLAKTTDQLAQILCANLETLPPATLERHEIRIHLPTSLLDASTLVVTPQDNALLVQIVPAKPETIPSASALLPRLVEIVETRLPAFPQLQITLAPPATPLPPSTPSLSTLPSAADIAQTTPILPPPADMAKAAAALAKLLFSRVENLTPETLEHRELRISLPPTLLDASTLVVTTQDNTLHVQIVSAKPETIPLASALLPRLVEIVENRLPAFPQVQITLAPPASSLPTPAPSLASRLSLSSLPKTAPVPIPPNEADQKEESPSVNTPPTLQALPLSPPVPLETPPATTEPPQRPATQPVAPAQNIPSAQKLVDTSTPPRQTNGNSEETPSSASLQALPFAAPAPFEASAPAPTPPSAPHAAPAPAAQPAIPAEEPLPREALQPLRPLTIPAQLTESPIPSALQANAPTREATDSENAPRKAATIPLQAAPVDIPVAPAAPVPLSDPAAAAQAASARTATIAEAANQIASAVAARILVSPSLAQGGDGEIRITLQPSILDGSQVTLTAQSGTLSVTLTPATPDAAQQAAAALPTLAAALEAHAPAFHRVQVALAAKKGTTDETA